MHPRTPVKFVSCSTETGLRDAPAGRRDISPIRVRSRVRDAASCGEVVATAGGSDLCSPEMGGKPPTMTSSQGIASWNAELAFRPVVEATSDKAGLEFLRHLVKNL